jgi:MOSC domain
MGVPMPMTTRQLTMAELEAGLDEILQSPADDGLLEMIVRRPAIGTREPIQKGELDPAVGLVGDTWSERSSRRTSDGLPHPEMQLNIMNARVVALVAQHASRWPLAGDQLFVDMDLSAGNLPPGTRLALGTAVIEVTAEPHAGCNKFLERFGPDAMMFVNASERRDLHLRGINARVVTAGRIRVGDRLTKMGRES